MHARTVSAALAVIVLVSPAVALGRPRATTAAQVPAESQTAAAPGVEAKSPAEILERPSGPPAPPRVHGTALPAKPQIGPFQSVQVNVAANGLDILGDAANEPSLAVDPTNPNRMVIGWRQFDDVLSDFRQAGWAVSVDAGRSWYFPGILEPGLFRSDPVLACDANGTFYYTSLQSNFACDVFVSANHGANWLGPLEAYGGDKPWNAVDRTTGIGRGNFYSAWSTAGSCCGTSTFTRSLDGGYTFSFPSPIPSSPIWGNMDVAPDGTLYVTGVDPNDPSRILVAKSSSVRDPNLLPFFDYVRVVDLGGSVRVQLHSPNPNPDGLLGQVWVGVDPSTGPRAGWIYVLCSVDPPGPDPLDVMFSRSLNGGLTWSPPERLDDDSTNAWQWFGTMSVAPNGRIDVVWNDTRNSGTPSLSELYSCSSSDGGVSWTPNVRLSPAWDSSAGWPVQRKIGDYYHMVSDRVGANLAWSATFNNEQNVWFLRIGDRDCNENGVGDSLDIARGTSHDWNRNGIPDDCENLHLSDVAAAGAGFRLLQNVPNPFNPETAIVFEAPPSGGEAHVSIYDISGRLVRTLARPVTTGRNTLVWDGKDERGENVPSGIYLYKLEAAGFTDSRHMVLLR